MSATLLFCIWLIPAPADYKTLSQEILGLSKQFGFPNFEPHTTLFCGQAADITTLKTSFTTLFQSAQQITVPTQDVQVQNQAQRNFFIQLQNTPALNALYTSAKTLDENSDYVFDPHVSLSYSVPVEKINPFAANYVAPNTIHFSWISLMVGGDVIEEVNMVE